jgi:hypothetical protein
MGSGSEWSKVSGRSPCRVTRPYSILAEQAASESLPGKNKPEGTAPLPFPQARYIDCQRARALFRGNPRRRSRRLMRRRSPAVRRYPRPLRRLESASRGSLWTGADDVHRIEAGEASSQVPLFLIFGGGMARREDFWRAFGQLGGRFPGICLAFPAGNEMR